MPRKNVNYTAKCSELLEKLERGQQTCLDGGRCDGLRDFVYTAGKTGEIHFLEENVWYCCRKDIIEDANLVWVIVFITRETRGVSKRYSALYSGFEAAMDQCGYERYGGIKTDSECEMLPKSYTGFLMNSVQNGNSGGDVPLSKLDILPNHIRRKFQRSKDEHINYYPYLFKIAFRKKVTPAEEYEDNDDW